MCVLLEFVSGSVCVECCMAAWYCLQASQLAEEMSLEPAQAVATLHEMQYQGIRMVRTVARLTPQWLPASPRVLRCLLAIWTNLEWRQRVHDNSPHSNRNAHELSLLVKILIQYCKTVLLSHAHSAGQTALASPAAGQLIQPLFDVVLAFSRPVGGSGV